MLKRKVKPRFPSSFTFVLIRHWCVVLWLIRDQHFRDRVVNFQLLPEDFVHLTEKFKILPAKHPTSYHRMDFHI